jgi:ATP-dependent Clp protease adapter protein ClpS
MTKFFTSSLLILATICLLISNAAALVSPNRVSTRSSSGSSSTMMSQPKVSFVGPAATVDAPAAVPAKIDPRKQQRKEKSEKTEDLWEVRLMNDKFNTHEWVARCLVVVVGTTEWQAYKTTKQAHTEGEAFLGLYEKEIAELYTQGLREQGLVVRMLPVSDFQ